ncbi:MAG: hypothetical protein ACREID_05430 [Planctomycetota bacterium]
MPLRLDELLDRVAVLHAARDAGPVREEWGAAEDAVAAEVLLVLQDRNLRPEHRARIYEDLLKCREQLKATRDPRLVDLVFWSEHVDALHRQLRSGRLKTFHYARALEATCRRCGFDFLPLVGRMDELGRIWGGRDFAAAYPLLAGAAQPHATS